jgi:hypothetical protein
VQSRKALFLLHHNISFAKQLGGTIALSSGGGGATILAMPSFRRLTGVGKVV